MLESDYDKSTVHRRREIRDSTLVITSRNSGNIEFIGMEAHPSPGPGRLNLNLRMRSSGLGPSALGSQTSATHTTSDHVLLSQHSDTIQSTTAPTHLRPHEPERSPSPHESPSPSPQTPSDDGSVTSQTTVYSTLPPSYCSCRSEPDLTLYPPLRPFGSGALRSLPSPPTSYDYNASRRETFRPRGPRSAGVRRPNSRRRSRAAERPRDEEEALAYDMTQLRSGRSEDSFPARGVVEGRQRDAALTWRQSSDGGVRLAGGPLGSYLNDSPNPPPAYSGNPATYDEWTVSH